MDCQACEHFEVEGESLYSLEQTNDTLWTYTLKNDIYQALFNITMLFRGNDDNILDDILYVVMTVNGICVDTLQSNDEDYRVKEFSFTQSNAFPSFAESVTSIIVAFKQKTSHSIDKIRIIADAIIHFKLYALPHSKSDDLNQDITVETRIASLQVNNKKIVVTKGEPWTTDLIKNILDHETELLIEKNEQKQLSDDENLSSVDDIIYDENDLPSEEIELYKNLDIFLRWRAQQILIRNRLTVIGSIVNSS